MALQRGPHLRRLTVARLACPEPAAMPGILLELIFPTSARFPAAWRSLLCSLLTVVHCGTVNLCFKVRNWRASLGFLVMADVLWALSWEREGPRGPGQTG